ncbi:TetR family transcriptional regulator [Jidongwangia harbinensis]|uniref:TetR family transcriptional regulator n=1 Tax=Jidongwangia harbinensis TaxID=2878561 RepID=UPI001CDA162B|nr:TetR family transcriptional regulator [Jidongwangia harbinensis]MCA2219124.1 TetR family transcriptional regulator [Jidongwangia harbinensis]
MDRSQASRRRLLDAGAAEFAAHGVAGARVDRISADARVSKAQIYSYYAGKEQLFDAVLEDQVNDILDRAPLTADLPDYAVRLYDAYLEQPQLVRLATWARLERSPVGPLFSATDETAKVEVIAEAQRTGRVRADIPATDIHAMVIGLALTWAQSSLTYTATPEDPEADHRRRRASLAAAARDAFMR